jgi:hypothetical protein
MLSSPIFQPAADLALWQFSKQLSLWMMGSGWRAYDSSSFFPFLSLPLIRPALPAPPPTRIGSPYAPTDPSLPQTTSAAAFSTKATRNPASTASLRQSKWSAASSKSRRRNSPCSTFQRDRRRTRRGVGLRTTSVDKPTSWPMVSSPKWIPFASCASSECVLQVFSPPCESS